MNAQAKTLEDQLADEISRYCLDPLGFVLFAFPWGQEGTDLAQSNGPRAWQRDILRSIGDKLRAGYEPDAVLMPALQAVASGHGVGKSALVSMLVAWALCTCPDTKAVITANTEPQLRTKTFPEISKWFRLLICAHWFKVHGMSIHSTVPGHSKTWRADAVTWSETNLEAFAGLHNVGRRILLIFDEASGIIDRVWEVAEGALTDEGTEIVWCAFGNPTQPSGRFFECFNRQRNRWSGQQIDSRTVEGTNKALFEQWAEAYGEDSDFMRVRVKGQFPRSGSMQFIGSDIISEASTREVSAIISDALIIGVDVARYGDDQSVIFFRKGRDARMIPPILLRKVDTMQLAARVADEAQRYGADAVFIDDGGVGGGVVDRCQQMRVRGARGVQFGGKSDRANYATNAERYANKRAEMWGSLREWLKTGGIPDSQDLQTDLAGPWYFFNPRNEILLERKEDMKKRGLASPDMADALALTFAYPVMNSRFSGGPYGAARPQAQEYDPWE
ncbi:MULTISPECIES: terminase [unclassified Saccharibacter]|uniref:terminase n=1 Tax=unclassified Saccharibacter TaxID=2648722 RepID=UPI00132AE25B|nr:MULTISPECIES: terminase [unclassified Saccharibacter]MXV35857.1 terminase [Saccharibacter sp. EH611]MXV57977.1 terminase [Saccharibacter sp. EH70]MXV66372.1 terminase [Saccharibacter sp. EH60]